MDSKQIKKALYIILGIPIAFIITMYVLSLAVELISQPSTFSFVLGLLIILVYLAIILGILFFIFLIKNFRV